MKKTREQYIEEARERMKHLVNTLNERTAKMGDDEPESTDKVDNQSVQEDN